MKSSVKILKLFVTDENKDRIAQLRQLSYDQKFGFRVAPDGLSWNNHDDDSFHFGAIEGANLISTIRLTKITSKARFESMLQFSSEDPFSIIPCYALSRAATLPAYKGRALSMKLRAEAFRHLVAHGHPSEFLYGTALGDSLRLKFLQDLGYEMKFHDQPWKGYLASDEKQAAIFRIPLARLPAAIAAIESSIESS